MTNRKPQLYSPQPQLIKPQLIKPQLIKPQLLKKEDPLAQNVKAAKRKASSEASGIRKCNTCTKADKIKMLSVCLQCTEFYHLTCHNSSYDLDLDDELKTSCPACFG